jgi:hypothetical protein
MTREIERGLDTRRASWMKQRMLNGKRHRRRAKLSEQCAVVELDQTVNDALWMEDRGALSGA